MAVAFRPRPNDSWMNSRYGSQLLSVGVAVGCFMDSLGTAKSVVTCMAGFATLAACSLAPLSAVFGSEPVVTSMAGFARPQPGARTWRPAALRYLLAVSRRTPVACSMRRKDHPSWPKALFVVVYRRSIRCSCRWRLLCLSASSTSRTTTSLWPVLK